MNTPSIARIPWDQDRLSRLCLGWFDGFTSHHLRKLWQKFPQPRNAWLATLGDLEAAGITSHLGQRFIAWRKTIVPEKLLARLEAENIQVFFPDDADFPPALRQTSDPPEILFLRGQLSAAPAIALVGTRRSTAYGLQCAEQLVAPLAAAGCCIVSGLALGIDGAVHRITVDRHGTALAILGGGIDHASLYPRAHVRLAERILAEGGGLLSEMPPGTEPRKDLFPLRNRLIAGMSLATVVIEATPDSGSLITAKLALEENREVLAVPGPIWNAPSQGCHALIKSGAKLCTDSQDILDAIQLDRPELIAQARSLLPIDPDEERLLQCLHEPRHVDDLSHLTQKDIATVSSQLAILELKGHVKTIGGQTWIRLSK